MLEAKCLNLEPEFHGVAVVRVDAGVNVVLDLYVEATAEEGVPWLASNEGLDSRVSL